MGERLPPADTPLSPTSAGAGRALALDGVRALAVIFVLADHLWPRGLPNALVLLGPLGVKLFFALSGYLITAILLRELARADAGETSRRSLLGAFYARRAVRIVRCSARRRFPT